MKAAAILFCLLSFILSIKCDEEDLAARVFVYKSTATSPIVEGKPFVITYKIINNGDAAATKIDIMDRYDPNSFELRENVNADGTVMFSVDELAPESEYVYNVTVEPKLYGVYESTRARVRYNTGMHIDDVEDDIRSGHSTSLGRVKIISVAEFVRTTSRFIKEWVIFAVLVASATVVPFHNWKVFAKKSLKSE